MAQPTLLPEDLENLYEESVKCIRCGLCQVVCPVYAELRTEQSVARGKVRLVREILEGNIGVTPKVKDLMAVCLNCGACVQNCPPAVHTDKLVLAARARVVRDQGLPFLLGAALRKVLPSNGLQSLAAKMAYYYRETGLRTLLQKFGLLGVLGPEAEKADQVMPSFPGRTFRAALADLPRRKGGKYRVAYFISCMTNMVNPDLGRAAVKVLEASGCEVIIPPEVKCCGTPHLAYGDTATAADLARHNAAVLAATGADYIVTDCATCGATLKEYKKYQDRIPEAAQVAEKVYDISEFLVEKADLAVGPQAVPAAVTYHEACHLGRGQGVTAAPRAILKAIPGLEFREMAEADRCCGGAGTFNIFHYDLSMRILDRKIKNIAAVKPAMVAVGCPACKIQLEHGLNRAGMPEVAVVHPVELIARTYK